MFSLFTLIYLLEATKQDCYSVTVSDKSIRVLRDILCVIAVHFITDIGIIRPKLGKGEIYLTMNEPIVPKG